jgi:hypothetical protein
MGIQGTLVILPTFNGYTIDQRLSEFRKVSWTPRGKPRIQFVPFSSRKGRKLLRELAAMRGRKS